MTTNLPAASTVRTSSWTDTQQSATTTLNAGTSLASSYFDTGNQMLLTAALSATDRDDIRNEPLGVSRVARLVSGTETVVTRMGSRRLKELTLLTPASVYLALTSRPLLGYCPNEPAAGREDFLLAINP